MAGVLTQNLVLQKSKVDDLRRVQKLNVCAAQLQDIGVLRHAVNIEVLSLSLNEISELGAISNCHRLNELYLRKNQVSDINQVLHLTRLPYLEVLNISDNPISRDPNYRRFVVAAIPSLERLDDVNISDEEREAAVRVFPELTYFAPPASLYAQAQEGLIPPPSAAAGGPPAQQRAITHTRPQQQQQQRQPPPPRDRGNSNDRAGASAANNAMHRRPPNGPVNQPAPQQQYQQHQQQQPPRAAPGGNGTPMRGLGTPMKRQSSAPAYAGGAGGGGGSGPLIGPSETGVVQAMKVLCSELSPEGLREIRHFIDSMSGY